jgi:tetratricopeptide (TPR) repeat protein
LYKVSCISAEYPSKLDSSALDLHYLCIRKAASRQNIQASLMILLSTCITFAYKTKYKLMRYIHLHLLLLSAFILVTSCGNREDDPRLLVVEKLIEVNPDSARTLLLADSIKIRNKNRATRMYYDMMLTLANDKCYIIHKSDSTMLSVADYYESHGTPRQKFMSYYLLGRIYTDMNLTADAFEYYEKALTVDGVDSSFIYVARTNNQIGHLYMYQNMYSKALPYFKATQKYAIVAKDTSVIIFALRDIGRCYHELGKKEESLFYFNKTVDLVQKYGSYDFAQHIYPEIIIAYKEAKDYNQAKRYLKICLSHLSKDEEATIYSVGGEVYESANEMDTAIVFYKKTLESMGQNLYSKKNAAYSLSHIYKRKRMFSEASAYGDSCTLYADSIRYIAISENENLIKSLQRKIVVEKQNCELKNREYLLMNILIATIFIVGLAVYIMCKYIRNRNERYKKVKKALNLSEQSSQEEIIKRIEELDVKINMAQDNNDSDMEKKLLFDKNSESFRLAEIDIMKKKQKMIIELFKSSDVYFLLREKGYNPHESVNITQENWLFIYKFLNEKCNKFVEKLINLYNGISDKELQICCLIKLEFTNSQISNILNQTQSATSLTRRRLYEKIFHKNEAAEKLNQFIDLFPNNS